MVLSMTLDASPASESARHAAEHAVENARLINSADELAAVMQAWAGASVLGLDTEFVRERTFFPQPGLVQASEGQTVVLLDAVALPAMSALASALSDTRQVKILHSVGEDLEVLQILCGVLPQPLFDTQIAAAMLGMPLQCRYENLVAELIGVELPGGKARSDWRKRPLTRDLTTYAAQDVIWLPRLHDELRERLERAGRLAWLEEDCARLVASAGEQQAEAAVLRVKGAGNLSDPALEVLERLARWREGEARRRDLPRSFVARDEILIALAASCPGVERERQLRNLPPPLQRRYGQELAALLAAAPLSDFERPLALAAVSPQEREAIKQYQAEVTRIAGELGLEPALLASRREIAKVVRGERPAWTRGWRRELLAGVLDL